MRDRTAWDEGYDDGTAAERARIVAWLREELRNKVVVYADGTDAVEWCINGIEREEHLK